MRADFLMLADRASVRGEGEGRKLDIEGAGITHVRVEKFPGSIGRLSLIARLVGDEDDLLRTEPVKVLMRWFHPDGTLIAETDPLEIPPEHLREPSRHAEEERSYFWIVDIPGFTFDEPGIYRLILVLDGETVIERPLAVLQESTSDG
jgi:hypothetical protein